MKNISSWTQELLAFTQLFSRDVAKEAVIEPEFVAHSNRTCGLHVHIGKVSGSHEPLCWTLEEVKRILMCFILFEDVIDGFHTNFRQTRSACASVRRGHFGTSHYLNYQAEGFDQVCPRPSEVKLKSMRRLKEEIFEAQTLDELGEIDVCFNNEDRKYEHISRIGVRNRKLNICQLLTPEPNNNNKLSLQDPAGVVTSLGTIEWRQHAATTDPEAITNWIWFAAWFCSVAAEASEEVIDGLVFREDLRSNTRQEGLDKNEKGKSKRKENKKFAEAANNNATEDVDETPEAEKQTRLGIDHLFSFLRLGGKDANLIFGSNQPPIDAEVLEFLRRKKYATDKPSLSTDKNEAEVNESISVEAESQYEVEDPPQDAPKIADEGVYFSIFEHPQGM